MIEKFKLFSFENSEGRDVIHDMFEYRDELMNVLRALDNNTLFNESTNAKEDFTNLLTSFVEGQRGTFANIAVAGSWGLVDCKEGIPSDARVDFVFMPTYIITAILARTYLDYPEIANSIPRYKGALIAGFNFCSLRGLQGHGYEGEDGRVEALKILNMGHVPELLEKNPAWCNELAQIL